MVQGRVVYGQGTTRAHYQPREQSLAQRWSKVVILALLLLDPFLDSFLDPSLDSFLDPSLDPFWRKVGFLAICRRGSRRRGIPGYSGLREDHGLLVIRGCGKTRDLGRTRNQAFSATIPFLVCIWPGYPAAIQSSIRSSLRGLGYTGTIPRGRETDLSRNDHLYHLCQNSPAHPSPEP